MNEFHFGDTKVDAFELKWNKPIPQALKNKFDVVIAADWLDNCFVALSKNIQQQQTFLSHNTQYFLLRVSHRPGVDYQESNQAHSKLNRFVLL